MGEMTISVYPIADGCLRPPQVLARARECLLDGQRVAISSCDRAFDELDGAVLVRHVGKAFNAFHAIKPAVAVIDALDFTDPDGQEVIARQEMPHGPPVPVAGDQLRKMLDLLRDRSGTGEVLLVSVNDAISPAWERRLERWDVHIRRDLASSKPWRTWSIGLRNPGQGTVEYQDSSRFPVDPDACISQSLHSPRAHLLLALAMEYVDVFCREGDVPAERGFLLTENPGRLLVRMLAGKPVRERIALTEQLLDDIRMLGMTVEEMHRALQGVGSLESPGKKPSGRSARVHLSKSSIH